MIIHNEIHQALVDISSEQGWNEESQILHLCGFIHWIRRNGPLHELTQPALDAIFRTYLQAAVDEENAGVEAVCERDRCTQDQEDHESMVESTVDRQIFDEITRKHKAIVEEVRPPAEAKQPQATDFTEVIDSCVVGKFVLRIKLDSGEKIALAWNMSREEAERKELAINQAMIEYRTKRNAWEMALVRKNQLIEQAKELCPNPNPPVSRR